MKRPWNRTDTAVYSLATKSDYLNMNICTYVQAISMQPKLFMIALEYNSATEQNFRSTNKGVLQLLSSEQLHLIKKLGFISGVDEYKLKAIENTLANEHNFYTEYLADASAILNVTVESITETPGDHAVFICNVTKWKNLHETPPMQLQQLREAKIIRG